MSPLWLVVTLTVRRSALAEFRSFEHQAAAVMARHGGRIAQALVLREPPAGDTLQELHLVQFPSDEAFAAYRRDPALAALAPLRALSVVSTRVETADEGPDYGSPGAGEGG